MAPQVLIVGGGMIVHDQILPSLYHLERLGIIAEISICSQSHESVRRLAEAESLARAFPGQSFRMFPAAPSPSPQPALYREIIAALPPRQIVVVALPDQLHYEAILEALRQEQHVLAVKPLVLRYGQAEEIAREARTRGLLVGVEYHKRFDDRSLMARRAYREGRFGEFRLGTACLFEKWYYRHSNFQNWMTAENSDAFTYIGCHYVDLVHFITGLLPVSVSLYGILDRFPNGNQGYLWTDARVIWNNGGSLNVQNALGFPDAAPGTNTQGLTLFCQGASGGGLLSHSDQYRGLKYCYTNPVSYQEPSPDYFQYVDLGGPGLAPVGYGYRSIEAIVRAAIRVNAEGPAVLEEIDRAGIIATPGNSSYNERVIEAARESILNGGREVRC
ncbi:MAG TPA: Gfo/Idh/MocA family oxidoreductase [Bryobacteraceae bacterium]|nr:Gfo/Idh/MocA family oxidoreductase [Bryobacteraceae bacterium]